MGCCGCCAKKADVEKQGLAPAKPAQKGSEPNVIGKSSGTQVATKETLQKKIENATKIGVLILKECGLKSLPEQAVREGLLTKIRTADISVNRLSVLPSGIVTWCDLQSLNASDNVLEILPDAITKLQKLQKLTLSRNRLVALPEGLGDLKLTELKCDNNQLTALPDAFGGDIAESLEELDVSSNRLENLPGSICCARMLKRLLLQTNSVSALNLQIQPEEGLSRLQYVNAAENKITEITPQTLRLPALSELWLKDNPIDRLALQQTEGFEEFAERRKKRLDQKIEQNVVGQVDLSMCGLSS